MAIRWIALNFAKLPDFCAGSSGGLDDPNTWKLPAELIGYWQTILAGLAAIGAFILGIIRCGLKPLRWLWSGTKGKAPEKSIT